MHHSQSNSKVFMHFALPMQIPIQIGSGSGSGCLWRASLLWRVIDGVLAKALRRQWFIESTSNVSYVDDRELSN